MATFNIIKSSRNSRFGINGVTLLCTCLLCLGAVVGLLPQCVSHAQCRLHPLCCCMNGSLYPLHRVPL